ncbi:SLBB domain-containing protein [Segetibacter sp.]|uniref:SLBB domain-containing protein n=1 Tax=Segetibacter sp. TaxID=2231182 RepID=UPI00262291F4|nr:SLBB domain-containing protein [Segetibacter sp.]MCW3079340.1 polysialic acid transport protein [Segetibacter sp.]
MKFKIFFASILILLSFSLFAQIPSLPSNLSNAKSSDISEEQLTQIKTYLSKNNLSTQQAYDLLLARGMNPAEATNLRGRLEVSNNVISGNNTAQVDNTGGGERRTSDTTNKTVEVINPRKIFGLEIFNNGVLSFEPNINIATPVGYVIGPNDEININIFGYQEAKYNLKVGPEGDINIPYVGVMYVAGLTIEQATARIRNRLSTAGYANIRTGLTKVSVSIGRIRSIKVTILGEVKKPGSYTLPSLATAFNALYLSGGPTEMGSMRNIEIVRNGRVVAVLDIYDFLVKADQRSNLLLQDQDVIRIPAYKVRVSLEGEVKRTGLFEMKQNETLQTLLEFAGGFSDSAYTASITGYKVTDVENRIIDINQNQFAAYRPGRSESFVVKKILGRFINRVTISGAVYLPGDYELTEGMTLKDLINKARGLKQDAYNGRGLILRSREDLTPEYLSFSPIDVVKEASANPTLKPNDRVTISSVSQLRENTTVSISGEVRNAGGYSFVENMSLKDLILLAGGFTDAAIPQRIEVARRLKTDSFNISDIRVSEVFNITSLSDLQEKGSDIKLQSYDAVIVRKNPSYQPQVSVSVEGEVPYPGAYVLKNKSDRISDVIKRAGGLTLQAFEQGGYVTRRNNKTVIDQLNSQKINRIQETLKDTSGKLEQQVERGFDQIAIDLNSILNNPGSKNDLVLEEGDVITIPKEKMDVRISGQVLFPTRVVYQERMDLKDYLSRAGGVSDNARKSKIYVLYPNGNAAKTSHFLFFKNYPRITPGSEVIVPKKHEVERRRLSTGEVIGISTAITSFAGVLLSLLINATK